MLIINIISSFIIIKIFNLTILYLYYIVYMVKVYYYFIYKVKYKNLKLCL